MRKKLFTCLITGALAIAMCIPVMASTANQSSVVDVANASSQASIIKGNGKENNVDLPDNETLFKGYVSELFGFSDGKLETFESVNPEDVLDELNLYIYNSLKEQIADVADGNTSSTVFTVSIPDGLSGTVDSDNSDTVLDALLVNCPYELYWYDKTDGCVLAREIIDDTVTFKFTVAKDYRIDKDEEYETDTTKTGAASTAKKNADAIVSKYSGYTDLNKLYAFKNEICDLVSYNDDAMAVEDYPYGDPWQLIYVFDGNPSTNVVCEGYSKAFQYLCDHSHFSDSSITCRIVTGYMDSEGHMWNVVTMDDEKNYIVDITNCDEDTVGESDKLFLAGAKGSVALGYTWTTTNSNGDSESIVYAYDKDSSMTSIYSNKDLAIFHADYTNSACKNATTYLENAIEATCGTDGYTGDIICSACNNVAEKGTVIPATGKHDYGSWTTTKAATVFVNGLRTRTCINCGTYQQQTTAKLTPTIKLSKTSLTMKVKKKYQLKVVTMAKGDSVKSWKSGNKKIAVISSKGIITAKKKGTVTITVTLKSGKKATCKVKVKK